MPNNQSTTAHSAAHNPILRVEGVGKRYANHTALTDMTFDVPRGSVYGLLGPNGAGKTTLLRIINRITLPDTGTVALDGHPLQAADTNRIGYLPEERGLYKKMKVGEQAIFFARLKGLSHAAAESRLKGWFERLDIMQWWGRKVEELSKGMAQKVQFIITVLHEPELLILDEPFSGFDPVNANMLKEEIMRLRAGGTTIILSTHNMASVEEICDNITLIDNGHNVLSGNVEEIRTRHCRDRYTIGLAAIPADADALLASVALEHLTTVGDDGRVMLNVHLRPDVKPKELIALLNDHAEIRSFNPAMASMNEIFINTVKKAI